MYHLSVLQQRPAVVNAVLQYGAAFALRQECVYDGLALFDRTMSSAAGGGGTGTGTAAGEGAGGPAGQWPLCLLACLLVCARHLESGAPQQVDPVTLQPVVPAWQTPEGVSFHGAAAAAAAAVVVVVVVVVVIAVVNFHV
jgi:hypothetical protein